MTLEAESGRLRPIEVLLVEDSPSDRLLTLEALAASNVLNAVHAVDNGLDAIDYLRRRGKFTAARRPDLILLDLNLPKKDGREVLSEIKVDPLLKIIPVIVLTTSGADEDLIHAYQQHANGYVSKPVDFDQFTRTLRALGGFWFEVATLPPEPRESAAPRKRSGTATRIATDEESIQVLLIEDSVTDTLLIREALSASGAMRFDVTHATRLSEAQPLLAQRSFDLIVTDLGLPDSQGLDTVRKIRQLGVDAPLVVLTSLDDDDTGVQALRDGAHDYLVKGELTPRAVARAARYAIDKRIQQEQRRQAQKLEAVGRLAAGIAHDFNNVLSIVRGNAELLADTESWDEVRGSAHEIQEAADRAMSLARRLLTFTQQQQRHDRPLDLNQLVGDFTRMLKRLLGEHVQLELQLAGTLPSIVADSSMLEQVLLNLAVNARDAMPSGGRLTVATDESELDETATRALEHGRAGRFVRLRVRDTGVGMSEEVRERVFEPFFTTKPRGQGTGLGLATVYGIVQQHQGFLEVQSSPGQGTTFEVYLPAAEAPPAKTVSARPTPSRGNETLLVVEDEQVLRQLAARVLGRAGYRVLTAATAAEARLVFEEHAEQIQLLLTDMVLPEGETGRNLAEALVEQCPALEVVFMSGYSPDYQSSGFVLEPGVNFLQKPFPLATLLDTVRRRLDRKAPHVGSG